jgi:hypothetical protein
MRTSAGHTFIFESLNAGSWTRVSIFDRSQINEERINTLANTLPTLVRFPILVRRSTLTPNTKTSVLTGSILYILERGVDNDDNKACCYVRVLDIVKPIIAKDSHYDGHLPPPVKGELLRGAGGRLIKIRKPDLVNLPILPEPL